MNAYRMGSMRILTLGALLAALWSAAPSAPPDAVTVKRVRAIQQAHARAEAFVRNYHCGAVFTDWRRQGTKEQEFPGDRKGWTTRSELAHYYCDSRGWMRVQRNFFFKNAQGKPEGERVEVIKTWNGIEERDSFNGQLVISEKDTASAVRKPADFARVRGETVPAFLERALGGGWAMRMVEDVPTTCTLAVEVPEKEGACEYRLSLDPGKGYYLTRCERRRGGRLLEQWASTPKEGQLAPDKTAKGIWFPDRGTWRTFVEEVGRQVLDAESTLKVRTPVSVNTTVPLALYTLKTDMEKIASILDHPIPESIRHVYVGHYDYPGCSIDLVRFDLSADEFGRVFDGKGHCPAAADLMTSLPLEKSPVNGSLRDYFNDERFKRNDSGELAYPWWRPEELPTPVYGWTRKVDGPPHNRYLFLTRYLFAVGREDRGYRRVYLLSIWTD